MLGPAVVVWRDGRIVSVGPSAPDGVAIEVLPVSSILAPGYVDLQVNGGGGVLFGDTPDVATLRAIADAHAALGTTSLLPTLISGSVTERSAAVTAVSDAMAAGVAGIAGLHVEGPFIAAGRRGIHGLSRIASLTETDIEALGGVAFPCLVTLAPECVADGAIGRLSRSATVFAGHTDATFERMDAARGAGLAGVTHLFNAMSPWTSRAPGVVGAAFDLALPASLIADGIHAHPASLRLAFRMLGADRLALISDAMPTVGSDTNGFSLDGLPIRLVNGTLTAADGTLAGAHLDMATAVRNAVLFGLCGEQDALRMATSTPARLAGLTDRGVLRAGARADMLVLSPALEVLRVYVGACVTNLVTR